MVSERPHVLPRTVGSRGRGRSQGAFPGGTVRSPRSPKPERGRGQSSWMAGSESGTARAAAGLRVVALLTPLRGRKTAGEVQASF